jgi:tellurite resistance protein TerA
MIVTPQVDRSEQSVCVIAEVENVRNGIKLTNHTEYFPGHAEMDRAFAFGLSWSDGEK